MLNADMPRVNGQCERYNRTIISILSTISAYIDSTEWDTHLKQVQSAVNAIFNEGINQTPPEALMDYQHLSMSQANLLADIGVDFELLDLFKIRENWK